MYIQYVNIETLCKACGKQWEATATIQSLVKLLPLFLSLQWKTCLRQNCSQGSYNCSEGPALGHNTLMMMLMMMMQGYRIHTYLVISS